MAHTYTFQDQKEGEEVVVFLRRHWLTHLGPLLTTVVIFLVPLFVWFFVFSKFDLSWISDQTVWIAGVIWFLIGVAFFIYTWLDWYLDIFLVTNLRIIDINQNGLFHRVVGETSLEKVQDVIYEIKGIIPTLFNFGNVIIHTGGPTGDIVFESVSHPHEIQRMILNQTEQYKDINTEKIATPEDLLSIMLEHERKKIAARESVALTSDTPKSILTDTNKV